MVPLQNIYFIASGFKKLQLTSKKKTQKLNMYKATIVGKKPTKSAALEGRSLMVRQESSTAVDPPPAWIRLEYKSIQHTGMQKHRPKSLRSVSNDVEVCS